MIFKHIIFGNLYLLNAFKNRDVVVSLRNNFRAYKILINFRSTRIEINKKCSNRIKSKNFDQSNCSESIYEIEASFSISKWNKEMHLSDFKSSSVYVSKKL